MNWIESFGVNERTFNAIAFLAITFILFFFLRILFKFFTTRLQKLSERTDNKIDDVAFQIVHRTNSLFFLTVALYLAANATEIPTKMHAFIGKLFVVVGLMQVASWVTYLSAFFIEKYTALHRNDQNDGSYQMVQNFLQFLARVVIWITICLLILDNLGVNITALVTGLGVGGIAIALAVQNMLGDLFASLSIVLDKPFVIGDSITVGESSGTVEKIGLKTTRLRATSGEQLIFANNDLLKSRIQNFKRMRERRIVFNFGIIYQTPIELVKVVPEVCQKIVNGIKNVRFDRAHFQKFGSSSLDYELVYFVLTPDYHTYMDIQQRINLELLAEFKKRGIEFSFPSQTLYIDKIDENVKIESIGKQLEETKKQTT